jgi:ADP-heptose:LPS heptosyltransferase
MSQDRKIVVWVHHGLGDVIMALPMLTAIDQACSAKSSLVLIVKSNVEENFLRLLRWKASVAYINLGHSGGWNYKSVLLLALRIRRMKPDAFLAPHASSGGMAAVFSRLIGAPLAVGPSGRWSWLGCHRAQSGLLR